MGNGALAGADRGPVVGEALGELTSEELAWQAGRGCRASFTELVRRFTPRLQAFLRHRTRDRHEAEDLVQDTFLRVYENLDRYESSRRFSTWLFTIASRAAISRHRRKRLPRLCSDAQAPACDDVAQNREQQRSLWATAARLPEGQYQSLWLRYAEDMPVKEIARVMGKSQVCVKVLLYRARLNMAKYLEEAEP
ncbi:MAG TPA: sigma-70 family RNA polymerase sigma factor [Sedimentisphaerales bacterium]|nr:sigma-70 family RNA polymerase sigma factor [Sedimentisphaerales bacterium]